VTRRLGTWGIPNIDETTTCLFSEETTVRNPTNYLMTLCHTYTCDIIILKDRRQNNITDPYNPAVGAQHLHSRKSQEWEQPRVEPMSAFCLPWATYDSQTLPTRRVCLSYVAHVRQKALMGSKEQNKLVFGAQEHLKGPWALSFFLHGLQSTLFTTVGSQRPVKSSFQRKEQKKVPWAVEYQNAGLSWIYPTHHTPILSHPCVIPFPATRIRSNTGAGHPTQQNEPKLASQSSH
jgi:hypothetical protein